MTEAMLCRLCLTPSDEWIPVDFIETTASSTSFLKIIAKCLRLDLTSNDGTKMCLECWRHLNDFDKFCKYIEKQQNILHDEASLIKYEIEMAVVEENMPPSPKELTTITNAYDEQLIDALEDNDEMFIDMKNIRVDSIGNVLVETEEVLDEDELTEDSVHICEDDEPLINWPQSESDICTPSTSSTSRLRRQQVNIVNKPRIKKRLIAKDEQHVDELDADNLVVNECADGETKKLSKAETIRKSDEFIAAQMQMICDICKLEAETYSTLLEHYRTEHNCRGYIKCCNRVLKERAHLVDHIKYHLNPAEFQCKICHALPKSTYNLNTHMQRVHSINNYKTSKSKKVEIYETDDNEPMLNDATNDSMHDDSMNDGSMNDILNDVLYDSSNDVLSDSLTDPTYTEDNVDQNNSQKRSKSVGESSQNDEFIARNMVLKCDICEKPFQTFIKLLEHYRNEHNCAGYVKCCNRKWKSRPLLVDHLKYHINPAEYKCESCNKSFISQYNLSRHMTLNHATEEQLKYQCATCEKRFAIFCVWERHSASHETERNWLCKLCEKTFTHKYGLAKHMKNVHERNEESFVCNYCGETYTSRYNFRRHVAKHEGRLHKPVRCTECGLWLNSRANLRVHMQIHNPSPSVLKCEFCDRTTTSMSALKSHLRYMHQKQAQFACTICEKAFKSRVNLQEHIAKHTGEKLYTCPHCPREFRSGGNMSKHIKKTHPEEWSMRTVQSRRREIYKNIKFIKE